jgi:SAM-dependent methyltransferase
MPRSQVTQTGSLSTSAATTTMAAASSRVLSDRATLHLFAATLFLSAMLLFAVQPMFTKMVLPLLGGTPAVWSVAMVFFQGALLGGYVYAHLLTRYLSLPVATGIHIALCGLAILALPITIAEGFGAPPAEGQAFWLVTLYAASVGLPFFALAGNGPLLQAWFARTGHPHASDPYFLYGASNIGSFVALLSYPILFEPLLPVTGQSLSWAFGFGALVFLIGFSGITSVRRSAANTNVQTPGIVSEVAAEARPAPNARRMMTWLGLSFVPSALLVAVTAHLSTDIAAAPFLWVLPLSLFLLTFVITFQRNPFISLETTSRLLPILVAPVAAMMLAGTTTSAPITLALHLGLFFVAAMVCHGELVKRRPPAEHLTAFYAVMSLGGALGGLFAGLLAPMMFNWVIEYPVLIVAALLCRSALWDQSRETFRRDAIIAGVVVVSVGGMSLTGLVDAAFGMTDDVTMFCGAAVLAIMLLRNRAIPHLTVVCMTLLVFGMHAPQNRNMEYIRSFFGVHKVGPSNEGNFQFLMHGTTLHGAERIRDEDGKPVIVDRPEPLTYYWHGGAMANVIENHRSVTGGPVSVGVVGLGTGSLACYRQPGDSFSFYEIDPHVIEIARDPARFSFLNRCAPNAPIILGDARLTLKDQPSQSYDVLVVDAFSSDAIPTHLLTVEAVAVYLRVLKPGGKIVFHISNRHMALQSVVAAIAEEHGLHTLFSITGVDPDVTKTKGYAGSEVAAVTKDPAALEALATAAGQEQLNWHRVTPDGTRPWTDDYSNIVAAIWRNYANKLRN